MKNCKSVATPMEVKEKFISESESEEDIERQTILRASWQLFDKCESPRHYICNECIEQVLRKPENCPLENREVRIEVFAQDNKIRDQL